MTMTIGTREADGGAIIRNLERRFAVLEQCKAIHNFLDAEREYISYLEGEKRLHPFLRLLADDERYYDVMTRVLFVFNAPYYKDQPPEGIRIPIFLKGSRFENMNWETIKSTEIKRRTSVQEAVRDETVGCGSAERAHIIGNDVTLRSYLSLPRKLHFDLVERLTKDIEPVVRSTAPKLISEGATRLSHQVLGGTLEFNKNTGVGKLDKKQFEINPTSQEAKVLFLLMSNVDGFATYADLLGTETAGKDSERRKLTFIIRNLKETLGILPREKAENKNVIRSVKRVGYRLLTQSQSKHNRSTK